VLVTDLVDTISFDNGALVIDGGQITYSNFENFGYTGSSHYVALAVNAGDVTLGGTSRFDSLTIGDGATVTMQPGNGVLIARSLSLQPTALLDLTDNDLLVDPQSGLAAKSKSRTRTPDPLTVIQALINSARHNGLWDGFGITSRRGTRRVAAHHYSRRDARQRLHRNPRRWYFIRWRDGEPRRGAGEIHLLRRHGLSTAK